MSAIEDVLLEINKPADQFDADRSEKLLMLALREYNELSEKCAELEKDVQVVCIIAKQLEEKNAELQTKNDAIAAGLKTTSELCAKLERQLPDGMKHCTIVFHECAKGHGWLSATNWVPHGCPTCKQEELQRQLDAGTGQSNGRMCSCIECVGNLPDGPEPDGWLYESSVGVDVVRHRLSDKFKAICPPDMQEHQLYRLPPNIHAIIDQAKAEERERLLNICEDMEDFSGGYIADAIRARKP